MKLYITVNKPIPNSYTGIDLATQKIDFNNLDPICERAECTEMILDSVLSHIIINKLPDLLKQLITRLRKGGKIIIIDTEINEVLKKYLNGLLNIYDVNCLLFGNEKMNKRGKYSHSDIQQILTNNNLEIISIALNSTIFTLTAQRN